MSPDIRMGLSIAVLGLGMMGCAGSVVQREPLPAAAPLSSQDEAALAFMQGQMADYAGDYERAVSAYRQALQGDPNSASLRRSLVRDLIRLERFLEAVSEYQQLVQAHPDDEMSQTILARMHEATGNTAMAESLYRAVIARDQKTSMPFTQLGILLLRQDQEQEGVNFLRQALQINPQDREARQCLIQYYRANKQPDAARELLQDVLKLTPEDEEWLLQWGALLNEQGQSVQAVEVYQQLIRKNPKCILAYRALILNRLERGEWSLAADLLRLLVQLDPEDLLAKRNLGLALYQLGQWEEARANLNLLVQAGVADGFTHFLLGSIYRAQGLNYLAVHEFRSALHLGLELADCYLSMAQTLMAVGENEDAAVMLEEASRRYPRNFQILTRHGLVLLQLKRPSEALKVLDQALEIEPDDARIYFHMGRAYLDLDDFEMAVFYFKKAIRFDPDFAEVYNYLGYIHSERGLELEQAVIWLHKALALDPNNGYYLDSLGWAYYQQKNYREALVYVRRACETLQAAGKTVDAVIYDHLGDILLEFRDYNEAEKAWRLALEQDPDNRVIRKKLKSLLPSGGKPLHGVAPY